MQEKLELKILTLVLSLLFVGIIAAGFMVTTIEKSSLYSITEASSEVTAEIIARDIEKIMIEGRSDLTKDLLTEIRKIQRVSDIAVIHFDGHDVYGKSTSPQDVDIMKNISSTRASQTVRDVKRLTFYKPMMNDSRCKSCHANDPEVLGAVRISLSIEREYNRAMYLITLVIVIAILAGLALAGVLWLAVRKMIIVPVKRLATAADRLSHGDLSHKIQVTSRDEVGRLTSAIQDSMYSISGILKRVKDVSKRIARVSEEVGVDSKKIADSTVLEAESITNISSSIEEMNASISEIADGTEGLAASAEETAASMEQMSSSISQINESTQELSVAVETTSASIEQLSATIREVAKNAEELAASADETQSAIMEISSSVKEVEQSAKESAQLTDKVKTDAITLGMTSVEKSINGMKNIKASVEKTADYITKLGGRSEEIGKILNVIDEVTDQTTLLALNAAILAAQAGEHGKGFSVVADEIKQLADKTSLSTQEIASLIQAVQHEVRDAVTAMDEGLRSVDYGFKVTSEAADALRKVVESSKKSSEMSKSIERSTTEQAKATRLVSEAMERVRTMVGQIAKATTEQSRGIQLIMRATEKISDVSKHVRTATNEQSINSKQVSQAIELVSDKSQQISRAINEQKIGSNQIWASIERIKDFPRENKERSFRLNNLLKELFRDSELTVTEMEKFTLADDASTGFMRMGIVPLDSPAEMFRRFSPLAEYLGRELRQRIDLKVAVDFEGAVHDIGHGVTQLCFMSPSTYIEAHKKYGSILLVEALRNGKPFQHSVIITRADSSIEALQDLKGRSFAFGDPHSTSSHIVPRGMLHEAGVNLKDLSSYNHLGHHDDVAQAVLRGEFDAGAVMESTALKYRDMGIKLLKYSEDIPEFNICASASLESKVIVQIKQALLSLNSGSQESTAILKSVNDSYTGFAEASDENYKALRVTMSKMGLL